MWLTVLQRSLGPGSDPVGRPPSEHSGAALAHRCTDVPRAEVLTAILDMKRAADEDSKAVRGAVHASVDELWPQRTVSKEPLWGLFRKRNENARRRRFS